IPKALSFIAHIFEKYDQLIRNLLNHHDLFIKLLTILLKKNILFTYQLLSFVFSRIGVKNAK
ncbi:MAG: hypothetical protein ACOYKH_10700, partial [Brevefilum fermentans]